MGNNPQLSPREKERLTKCMKSVTSLSRKDKLSGHNSFAMKHQMRAVLKMLGLPNPNRVIISEGLDIMRDLMPFKERRLRKLVDGRRPR
jgi:RAB protein geranylgeranyltransferase component A